MKLKIEKAKMEEFLVLNALSGFPDYTEWYLRITDDGEAPIKAELSGRMKSGLKVTFNGVDNAQLSLAQHRQLLRTN